MRPLPFLLAAALLAACTDSSSTSPQDGHTVAAKAAHDHTAHAGPSQPMASTPVEPVPQAAGTVIDLGLGLRVEIQEEGHGPAIQNGSHFDMHFAFFLAKDMTKVQSTYDLGRVQHHELGIDMALPGFREAVPGLKEGTKARLYIPAHKGYAEEGFDDVVPPYADLILDVHIVKVYGDGEHH
jgi:FKBP-type peptidyl-prolyl cis-trans isomerase